MKSETRKPAAGKPSRSKLLLDAADDMFFAARTHEDNPCIETRKALTNARHAYGRLRNGFPSASNEQVRRDSSAPERTP